MTPDGAIPPGEKPTPNQYQALRHGQLVLQLPSSHSVITYNRRDFYFAEGVFFKASSNHYRVTDPPEGIRVPHLPAGAVPVEGSRKRQYKFAGVIYEKVHNEWEVISSE